MLVAKGFNQHESIDFLDTFSPVAKLVTVKVLLAFAACKHRHLTQLDVSNVFLNGDLFEKVYMDLPPGYKLQGEQLVDNAPMVCHLHKIYLWSALSFETVEL